MDLVGPGHTQEPVAYHGLLLVASLVHLGVSGLGPGPAAYPLGLQVVLPGVPGLVGTTVVYLVSLLVFTLDPLVLNLNPL